jgi:FKBP-type peptidyl-prolyl cis-trans isomerase 2
MAEARQGDTVKVHYTGKLEDGTVFDTSNGREPLQFTIGEHQVIAGFEEAVVGMGEGHERAAEIPAEQAHGRRDERLVTAVDRDRTPPDISLNDRLKVGRPDGKTFVVTVTGLSDQTVTLDANHPLAGKDLTFDIELVGIE